MSTNEWRESSKPIDAPTILFEIGEFRVSYFHMTQSNVINVVYLSEMDEWEKEYIGSIIGYLDRYSEQIREFGPNALIKADATNNTFEIKEGSIQNELKWVHSDNIIDKDYKFRFEEDGSVLFDYNGRNGVIDDIDEIPFVRGWKISNLYRTIEEITNSVAIQDFPFIVYADERRREYKKVNVENPSEEN